MSLSRYRVLSCIGLIRPASLILHIGAVVLRQLGCTPVMNVGFTAQARSVCKGEKSFSFYVFISRYYDFLSLLFILTSQAPAIFEVVQ